MFDQRLPSPSLYLALLFQLATAQHNAPLNAPAVASSSSSPTAASPPSIVSLSPAALSSAANPFGAAPTSANYASPTLLPDPSSTQHSVLNYYFLLLAIFVIFVILLYYILLRKRKRRVAQATRRGQTALAADLERWPGDNARGGWAATAPTRTTGRWYILRPTRPQEGLNERGEAPPAYVAKPEPAHAVTPYSAGSMTPEWVEMGGKPPDYHETGHM